MSRSWTRRQWLRASAGAIATPAVGPWLAGCGGESGREPIGEPAALDIAGIHSFSMGVEDVDRSVAFYQALFGAPVQGRSDGATALSIGDGPSFFSFRPKAQDDGRVEDLAIAVTGFDPQIAGELLETRGVPRAGSLSEPPFAGIMQTGRERVLALTDVSGLSVRLVDPMYCGGGDVCEAELTEPGPLRLTGLSHLTVQVPRPSDANTFYQETLGFDIQAYQGAAPILGVGPGDHFLMFIPSGLQAFTRVHHPCFTIADFDVERLQTVLEDHGLTPRGEGEAGAPMKHWVSMRMPDRGGAPDGTPEFYFSDPDGIAVQLQDARYCGGTGYLGDDCS